MNVARYGLTILALIGLGLSQVAVISTPLGLADGSLYQRTIRESRIFTVAGSFAGSGPRDLSARRGALRSLLAHDLNGVDQPVVLRLQRYNHGEPMGDQMLLAASYLEGLGEEMTQPFSEEVNIQFQQFLPALWAGSDSGVTLGVQTSVSNANYIVQRSASGAWQALGTGMDSSVYALANGPDGSLYAAGTFTTAGGVTVNRIARWNGSSWSALGSGVPAGSEIRALAMGPDGSLYAGGEFTTIGGVSANRIARWNGSSWSALGTGMNNTVFALAIGIDGSLYAAGAFTTAGGVGANRIARWNGSSWSALGTGLDTTAYALAVGLDGSIYAGGGFTTAGGVTVNRIARWNGSSWSALGSGAGSNVLSIAVDGAGNVYAGGEFTTIGGVSANRIARWNGSAWFAMGSGANDRVLTVLATDQGVYAGGIFTTMNGVTTPDSLALWNGSTWTYSDADLPGSPSIWVMGQRSDKSLVVGYSTAGTATVASVTNVTNAGTMPSGATITITGPSSGTGRVYSIVNNTIRKALYLNLTISAGETVYLTVKDGTVSARSSFFGLIPSAVLPGSDSDFALIKGTNSISLLTSNNTMTATLSFTPQYESLDDATLAPALQ